MIKVNGSVIGQNKFGDGTLKADLPIDLYMDGVAVVHWLYDNDGELFTLRCIVDTIREYDKWAKINLVLPYVPNGRQDRYVGGHMFTLKSFCNMINEMNFDIIYVLDPHSDVTTALLNHVALSPLPFEMLVDKGILETKDFQVMFPDTGAAKKYTEIYDIPNKIIGFKHRNTQGRIVHYQLDGFLDGTKNVLIVDDIISYGGTIVAAAKELRAHGVEHIDVVVSHCETNVFRGEVLDYIDKLYTTDSILDFSKDIEKFDREKSKKIVFLKEWRTVEKYSERKEDED